MSGKATNEPIDKFNHGIDGIRYVCLAKVMVNRKRMVKVSEVKSDNCLMYYLMFVYLKMYYIYYIKVLG